MQRPIGLQPIDLRQAHLYLEPVMDLNRVQTYPIDQESMMLRLTTPNPRPIGDLKLTLRILGLTTLGKSSLRLVSAPWSELLYDQTLPITAWAQQYTWSIPTTPELLGAVWVEAGQARSNTIVFRGAVL